MKNKISFTTGLLILLLTLILGVWSFTKLEVSENIDASFPKIEAYKKIEPLLEKGKKAIIFSLSIPAENSDRYVLEEITDSLILGLEADFGQRLGELKYKTDVDPSEFLQFFQKNMYLFLDERDYLEIEKKISKTAIVSQMVENRDLLVSPQGLAMKDLIITDPLRITNVGLAHLKEDFSNSSAIENEGLFISNDGQRLIIHSTIIHNPSNSNLNKELARELDAYVSSWNKSHTHKLDYFGTFLIAKENALQIEKDIKLTLTIAVIAILILLLYYFRNIWVLVFFMVPGVFGVLLAITVIWIYQGSISGIAMSAGAVVLGIVVDYSFHFFSDFKQTQNAFHTRKQIFLPLLVSGVTTIVAFFSLTLANAKVLHDFGLFTAISLIGALVFVLVFLPSLLERVKKKLNFSHTSKIDSWVGKLNFESKTNSISFFLIVVVITAGLFFLAKDVTFTSDINQINYYPNELKKRELIHQNIDPDTEKRVQFYCTASTPNEAAKKNHELFTHLNSIKKDLNIKSVSSLGHFFVSNKTQEEKRNRWIKFWNDKSEEVIRNVRTSGDSLGFNTSMFIGFENWITEKPKQENPYQELKNNPLFSLFLLGSENGDQSSFGAITSVVVPKSKYEEFRTTSQAFDAIMVDGAGVMQMLVSVVKEDFNYLLLFASVFVFLAMLMIYGSFELTLISFTPIAISWIWILGFASILDIQFNFVNIILITFIFGLGDDFAIFITDGLQTKYKYGRKVLNHYKTGIILSSLSTILGTGVLFFAKHPAIKSIAAISVLGILTIVVVSIFIQPILFHFFITRRTEDKKPPISLVSLVLSIVGYTIFIIGSLIGAFSGFVIRFIPFADTRWKKAVLHKILKAITGMMLDILFTTGKRYRGFENLDFSNPSVIIANHSSFFDILAIARLHPKIVMFVNSWVYHSPLFGSAIRYADYIPVMNNMEDNIEKCKELVEEGYSIMIFPEGKRSVDGKINRFHKGAFKLAIDLNLDITPIILHGYHYTMPKYDYNLKSSFLTTVVLPRISNENTSFGIGYKERTKSISKYFKEKYKEVAQVEEAVDYQYFPLLFSYMYKGPVLEWYFRVKWKFEKNNYEAYHQLFGKDAKKVYDLGCGYGFFSHYLKQRNQNCLVLGYDYDQDKVDVAQSSYLTTEGLRFAASDIVEVHPENADGIIIADTLHYLTKDQQSHVLDNCLNGLNSGGVLLVRDGILSDSETHEWTKKTERWSTQIMKFNKVKGDLHFMPKSFYEEWASLNNLTIKYHVQSNKSSNTLLEFRKR